MGGAFIALDALANSLAWAITAAPPRRGISPATTLYLLCCFDDPVLFFLNGTAILMAALWVAAGDAPEERARRARASAIASLSLSVSAVAKLAADGIKVGGLFHPFARASFFADALFRLFLMVCSVRLLVVRFRTVDHHRENSLLPHGLNVSCIAAMFPSLYLMAGNEAGSRFKFNAFIHFLAGVVLLFARLCVIDAQLDRAHLARHARAVGVATQVLHLLIVSNFDSPIHQFFGDPLAVHLASGLALLLGIVWASESLADQAHSRRRRRRHNDLSGGSTMFPFLFMAFSSVFFFAPNLIRGINAPTDAQVCLDNFMLILAGISLLFARLWVADAPARHGRRARGVMLATTLPFVLLKLVSHIYFKSSSNGIKVASLLSFYCNVFSSTIALLVIEV